MTKAVTDSTFEADVLKSAIPSFVDFWAPWCGPCKAMGPILDELAVEYDGKINVVKMNVDENTAIPEKYGVMSIPTFIMVKNGETVDSFVGTKSKEEVKKKFDAVLA